MNNSDQENKCWGFNLNGRRCLRSRTTKYYCDDHKNQWKKHIFVLIFTILPGFFGYFYFFSDSVIVEDHGDEIVLLKLNDNRKIESKEYEISFDQLGESTKRFNLTLKSNFVNDIGKYFSLGDTVNLNYNGELIKIDTLLILVEEQTLNLFSLKEEVAEVKIEENVISILVNSKVVDSKRVKLGLINLQRKIPLNLTFSGDLIEKKPGLFTYLGGYLKLESELFYSPLISDFKIGSTASFGNSKDFVINEITIDISTIYKNNEDLIWQVILENTRF